MNLLECFKTAVENLGRHKTRSFLTMLGVIIGIASVIMMTTLGTSMKSNILTQFDVMQPDMITITAITVAKKGAIGPGMGGMGLSAGQSALVFTEYDVANMKALEDVSKVIPTSSIPVVSVEYKGSVQTVIRAITATDINATALSVGFESGGVFGEGKEECVIGYDVAHMFTDAGNITVGEKIVLRLMSGGSVNATVSGIMKKSSDIISRLTQVDTSIYVPIDPFYNVAIKSPHINQTVKVFSSIAIKAESVKALDGAQKNVLDYLNSNESDAKILAGPDMKFRATSQESTAKQVSSIIDLLITFIGAIAAISLVVGSIGIANIMLVTVTERTREIGIMKAVGAKSHDILQIFLTESIFIGLFGGVIGCILGPLLGYVIVDMLLGVPAYLSYEWFGISVLVGVAVGALAGYYPAKKATKVDPIVALRYE